MDNEIARLNYIIRLLSDKNMELENQLAQIRNLIVQRNNLPAESVTGIGEESSILSQLTAILGQKANVIVQDSNYDGVLHSAVIQNAEYDIQKHSALSNDSANDGQVYSAITHHKSYLRLEHFILAQNTGKLGQLSPESMAKFTALLRKIFHPRSHHSTPKITAKILVLLVQQGKQAYTSLASAAGISYSGLAKQMKRLSKFELIKKTGQQQYAITLKAAALLDEALG
jgi:predicted transcriptional regulator